MAPRKSLFQHRRVVRLLSSAGVLLPVFALAYFAAYLIRFAGEPSTRYVDVFFESLLWVILVKWSVIVRFRLHEGWKRLVEFHDLQNIAQAVTCGALAVTLIDAMFLTHLTIPRGIIVIDWGVTLVALATARALPRVLRDGAWDLFVRRQGTVCMIVGANESGEALLRSIRVHRALKYSVVGFVDDRLHLHGTRFAGVSVLGATDGLPALAAQYGVEEVLITSGDVPGKTVRWLMEVGEDHGFRVTVLPSYDQLLSGRVAVHTRPVAIEDLLCRPSVELDFEVQRRWLAGRVVMVTGSAGSIGSELCRQLLRLCPSKLVLVDRAETGQFFLEQELQRLATGVDLDVRLADLTDRARLERLLSETRPEIVIHAAAYKHVPLMESSCGEAVRNIVLATRHLVDLASRYAVQALVMISTDKAVNPLSVMGSCKRLAESYLQARAFGSNCRMVTVRFGNVLDSSGSVVPIFREQISRGGPVTVTHPDITRYFMLIPEAAQLVLQAGAMGQGGEVFVLDMGQPVRILDLAHDMIRLSGLRVGDDIEVQITGLRPGEKLHEELYDADEVNQPTEHPKILVATGRRRPVLDVIRDIHRLEELIDAPNEVVRRALKEIITSPTAAAPAAPRAAA